MSVAITGGPGSGKTTLLLERYRDAAREGRALLLAPTPFALAALRRRLGTGDGTTFAALAAELAGAKLIDDIAAEALFERAAQPLLDLAWPEFASGAIDPEVAGMRMPRRFLEAAFRLVRKLRESGISPETFLQTSQVGSTQFYAHPPNLTHADLLMYTKDVHRDSLAAEGPELQRQFRTEAHLAKILARLYDAYVALQERESVMTGRDAIVEATAAVRADEALRARWDTIFVDEAQDLNLGELGLLQALRGERLEGVTLAGDPDGATGTFRGARPDRTFALTAERVKLEGARGRPPLVRMFRARDRRAEAAYVADHVDEMLRSGVAPDDIAVLFRSVRHVRVFEEALLARDIAAVTVGDANVFADPRALDALALLWNVYDPFRHDYMLRTLAGPALALSDSSLALLCGEPETQTLLFAEDDAAPLTRSKRWDPRRDLRLGWNVVRGEADASLAPAARERVQRFRAQRERWVEASQRIAVADLARTVWSEGLAQTGQPDSAMARAQAVVLTRLLERIANYAATNPGAGLGDFLRDAESRGTSAFESCEESGASGFVRLMSIEAARGLTFEHVVIPAAQAGSFPRWYVPDAFLYSPTYGVVAKDNVGEAVAARTAKFSYYIYRTKARERYNEEERRAFTYALTRATKCALVTASDRATSGITAPEFLEELRAQRLPGTEDLTGR